MPETKNVLDGCGIRVKGLISEISHYHSDKNDRHYYSMILVVPDCTPLKVNIKKGSDPSEYREKVGTTYTCAVSLRQTQFGTFLEEI